MSLTYYDASVPVFCRYLRQLRALVVLAGGHVTTHALPPDSLLEARLAPDMLTFRVQVEIAANFAQRVCFPLANRPIPSYSEFPASFAGLVTHVDRALDLLGNLAPADFDHSGQRIIHADAGDATLALPAQEFLLQFGLPNFIFHVTMAYAILRQSGVAIGKQNFDGFHSYPREP